MKLCYAEYLTNPFVDKQTTRPRRISPEIRKAQDRTTVIDRKAMLKEAIARIHRILGRITIARIPRIIKRIPRVIDHSCTFFKSLALVFLVFMINCRD